MMHGFKAKSREAVAVYQDRYTDAGVNTDEADAGLKKLTKRIVQTWPAATAWGKLDIGARERRRHLRPGIAISTDR